MKQVDKDYIMKHSDALGFIFIYYKAFRIVPIYQQIVDAGLYKSKSGVAKLIDILERNNIVKKVGRKWTIDDQNIVFKLYFPNYYEDNKDDGMGHGT